VKKLEKIDKGVIKYRVRDAPFSYYANEQTQIIGSREWLTDTMIENVKYRRARINLAGATPNTYQIGYWRCENMGTVYSLEKTISDSISCTMTKLMSYLNGQSEPYFKQEVILLRDSLTNEELSVFDAWKNNVIKYPIK